MATMIWYVWNTKFTGAVSGSSAPYFSVSASEFRPWYSVSQVPVARKLVPPGMAERGDDLLVLLVHPTEQVERRNLVVVHALHHGELRGLLFGHRPRRTRAR